MLFLHHLLLLLSVCVYVCALDVDKFARVARNNRHCLCVQFALCERKRDGVMNVQGVTKVSGHQEPRLQFTRIDRI